MNAFQLKDMRDVVAELKSKTVEVKKGFYVSKSACPKPKTYRNREYLTFVRAQPCMRCGAPPPSMAHHERQFGGGGTGMKPPDTHTTPLCQACHQRRHATTFYDFWGMVNVPLKIIGLLTEFMRTKWPLTGSKLKSREAS